MLKGFFKDFKFFICNREIINIVLNKIYIFFLRYTRFYVIRSFTIACFCDLRAIINNKSGTVEEL